MGGFGPTNPQHTHAHTHTENTTQEEDTNNTKQKGRKKDTTKWRAACMMGNVRAREVPPSCENREVDKIKVLLS